MKNALLILSIFSLVSLVSCKTQEDIRRDKTVDSMNEQLAQTQQSTAAINTRFTNLEESLAKLNGQIEEVVHAKQVETNDNAKLLERISALEDSTKKQAEIIQTITDKLAEQSKYIDQVVKTLTELSTESKEPASKKKDAKEVKEEDKIEIPSIKVAQTKFKTGKLPEAREDFSAIADAKKSSKKDREIATLYLGMIEYKQKNFDDAKVYFSKLFTDNPDSTMAPQALIHLARIFIKQKSKDEARQSLDELISRFPKSKEASEANRLRTKI